MELIINDNLFNVNCVLTKKNIENGMMNKRFNDNFDGMLFIMKDEPHSFWMKNCLIPLDILFINNDKIIKIHHNCPPCKTNDCIHYEGNGNMVLEIYGGSCKKYNIKEGDIIQLNL